MPGPLPQMAALDSYDTLVSTLSTLELGFNINNFPQGLPREEVLRASATIVRSLLDHIEEFGELSELRRQVSNNEKKPSFLIDIKKLTGEGSEKSCR